MKFTQAFKMAISSIVSNKMRSFLTMLGVIIGVAAVITLISVGEGATKQITSQIQGLGTNLITINITNSRNKVITTADLDALKAKPSIQNIAPTISGNVTVKAEGKNKSTSLEASTPEYAEIRNIKAQSGRFLVQNDLNMRFRVALVGINVADELFGNRNILGKTISINGMNFSIIGILEEKGSSMGASGDDRVIIPLTTAQRLLKNKEIRTFYVSAASADTVKQAVSDLEAFMLKRFKDANNYRVFNQTDLLSTITQTTATLTMMLGGIAGISLLVGGIGIMNIMLVSVTERTREIGTRKAIGAKRRDIMIQFLIESLVISGLGGIIGILLGMGGSSLFGSVMKMPLTISVNVVVIATCFSAAVGIIFGLYPANKASKLRPIDALRYE